jgi:hypothetical protein
MGIRTLIVIAAAAGAAACAPGDDSGTASQDAATAPGAVGAWSAPRTSWGDPNLEGTYTNRDENGTPFERPPEFEGKRLEDVTPALLAEVSAARLETARSRAGAIGGSATEDTGAGPPHWYEHLEAENSQAWFVVEPADGKIPALTPEGQQRAAAQRATFARRDQPDTYTDLNLYDRCITRGMPGSMMPVIYGNSYDITQSPGYVAIRYEMIHEARIIPLGDSPHVGDAMRLYMGDARGRFEGDTLVVETTNFRGAAAYRNASETLKVVERFTPVDADTLRWEVRIDDPSTWTAAWTFGMPLKRDASQPLYEYACHEGNRGLENILSAARAAERAADAR